MYGQAGNSWNVKVSFLEIYNENVNDLLEPTRKNLEIREKCGDIIIENLSDHEVFSIEDTMQCLNRGDE